MSWDEQTQRRLSERIDGAQVREVKREATAKILGDTIALSEIAWQEPSRLAGWTRAHVATHIARNAQGMINVIDATLRGRHAVMYGSHLERDLALERGSERDGLSIQIDLDTTAGRLNGAFTELEENSPADAMIELIPGRRFRADLFPLIRLNELIIHHVDLDCGFEVTDVDPAIADWLIEWNRAFLKFERNIDTDRDEHGVLHVSLNSGTHVIDECPEVLLGWLTGRLSPQEAAQRDLPDQPRMV